MKRCTALFCTARLPSADALPARILSDLTPKMPPPAAEIGRRLTRSVLSGVLAPPAPLKDDYEGLAEGLRLCSDECLARWDFIPELEREIMCKAVGVGLFRHEWEAKEIFLKMGITLYGRAALLRVREETEERGPEYWDRVLEVITEMMVRELPHELQAAQQAERMKKEGR